MTVFTFIGNTETKFGEVELSVDFGRENFKHKLLVYPEFALSFTVYGSSELMSNLSEEFTLADSSFCSIGFRLYRNGGFDGCRYDSKFEESSNGKM